MPFTKHKLPYYIGAMGVDITESTRARSIGLAFEIPMLLAAIWILLSWWAESSTANLQPPHPMFEQALWGLFILETTTLCFVVDNVKRYLRGNWLNLIIIVFGIGHVLGFGFNIIELRLLRVLTISALASHVSMSLHRLLRRNKLGTTLIATFVIIIVAGTMSATLDPGIETPLDGIW
jgi:voltage-gated potassium channel